MIPCSKDNLQSATWQKLLANGITTPAELLALLNVDPNLLPDAILAAQSFALRVPLGFVARMEKGNINDPLLKQVLPVAEELQLISGYSLDPLAEEKTNPLPGLLHKYKSRVLLTVVGTCAINCRYCFRRHFPYQQNTPNRVMWLPIFEYIKNDNSISEVILSGGDPLVVSDQHLAFFIHHITAISHVKTIRIHTRLPIVLPERITSDLIACLQASDLRVVFVVHCNHANEIDDNVAKAMQLLSKAGFCLLNQSVLLKDINDSTQALCNLSNALFRIGILPYYLHLLDKVQGAAHFAVCEQQAIALIQEMRELMPQYLVPRLAREQHGVKSKLVLA